MTSSIASLLTVLALWVLLAVFCCGGAARLGEPHNIEYRVDGTGRASLTYSNETGGTEQAQVRLPWSKKFRAQYGDFLYISAQNKEDYGAIVASISVDGKIVKTSTSSGGYVIASSSTSCCP